MPKKQAKSKYTADRGIPGAFEGETVTRRRFMVGTAHATGAIATSAILLPALGFALGPLFENHKVRWQPVGTPDEFPDDTYVPKVITYADGIGEAGKTTVYVRKRNPQLDTDRLPKGFESEQYVAISTRCMHLGCPVQAGNTGFVCPCHGGAYNTDGKRIGGPPVRPLDRYIWEKRGDELWATAIYSLNNDGEKKSYRDPGQHTSGPEQWFYPLQP